MWWLVSPMLAFWICAFIGRYLYDDLVARFDLEASDHDRLVRLVVIGVGCYMAFSAGVSNVCESTEGFSGGGYVEPAGRGTPQRRLFPTTTRDSTTEPG
jgi:PiT family inorganic phosphate transporter